MATTEHRKQYLRDYQRAWVAKRRADWFRDKECVKCGSKDHLELDHIDPATKVHHAIWSWSRERQEAEIAKCQVLCQVCHQEKTTAQFRSYTHGTYAMRNRWKCDCEQCMEYVRRNKRESRARIKAASAGK